MLNRDELEHLQILLSKEPIIATWTAQDILEHPETVRESYVKHVRSFVLIGKGTASTDNDQPTITEYEKRLIKLVKTNQAAKGYITAEYGYGKTSTAVFIWHRCEQSEIVAVPPFQIQKLEHLLSATYGWVRFKLESSAPLLLPRVEQIYRTYTQRSIEAETTDEQERALLARLHQEGRFSLNLQALDYVHFFEEMTALVREAGYSGLVVIADEVQQYIEPDIKSGKSDPLTEIFNLIQALLTRKGQLPFGLLFSIPHKELGLMNDQRGDLVDRLKDDGLALDLGVIYNQTFASDLWHQLAKDLQFESLQDQIVLPETLEALGQISARPDLANGPRTVVDVFGLMARQYCEHVGQAEPFSPLDLINAFLENKIRFDNVSQLQTVIVKHLNHQFVKAKPAYQNAIKLMAAFPMDGLPEHYFERYQVRDAIDGLLADAQGDIVTLLGGSFDESGQRKETRAFLRGLEAQKTSTDWLDVTIREFMRNYRENGQRHQILALKGFQNLLKEHIFKDGNWKVTRSWDATFTQNRTMYYEGAFPNATSKNYPARSLQVQVMGENDELRHFSVDGDLVLTFRLVLNYEQPSEVRRMLSGQISSEGKVTTLLLNMSYNNRQENYSDLHATLNPVVSPWKITPTLLLSLYAYLEEKQAAGVVPKIDDETIKAHFQPTLLEHAFNQLFNNDLGATVEGVGGVRIIETLVKRELEKHYAQYKTLMTNVQWKGSLKTYHRALEHLPTPYERQGKHLFEKSKASLASEIFVLAVPSLETYLRNSPLLIKAEGSDKWRFTLHPLEEAVLQQIKASHYTEPPRAGGKARQKLERSLALKAAQEKGYRDEEFEEALNLLQKRGMVSFTPNRAWIIAEEVRVPQISELRNAFSLYHERLKTVNEALKDDPQIVKLLEDAKKYTQFLLNLETKPNEAEQTRFEPRIRTLQEGLHTIVQKARQQLFERLRQRVQQGVGRQLSEEFLNHSLPEGLFQPQLQTQRLSLLKTYGEYAQKRDRLQSQLDELYKQVLPDSLTEQDLLRATREEQRLFSDILQLEKQIAQFGPMLADYDKVRQLLRQGHDLQQRLKQIGAEGAATYQPELDSWSLGITSELSSQKLQALKAHSRWQERLDILKTRFDTQLHAEREKFHQTQHEYQTFLSSTSTGRWMTVVFNPSEPQDSYKQLWNQVYELLSSSIKRLQNDLHATYERAVRFGGGSLENLPATNRVAVQEELTSAQMHLSATIETTATWAHTFSRERLLEKIGVNGSQKSAQESLGPVVTQVQGVDAWLEDIEKNLYSYEQQVAAALLSPQEEAILALLKQLQQNAGVIEGVELGLLLQQAAIQNINWQDLLNLYSKQRLSIKITPVTFR